MSRRLTVVRPQVSFSKVDGVACHVVLEVLARVLAKAVGDWDAQGLGVDMVFTLCRK